MSVSLSPYDKSAQPLTQSDSPTFTGLTLSGLTASRLLAADANKALASVADLASWVAGTANQIVVAADGDGTITLSAPQSIHTAASPTFAGLDLTGITDGNIPYVAAGGFADSPLSTDGTDLITGDLSIVNSGGTKLLFVKNAAGGNNGIGYDIFTVLAGGTYNTAFGEGCLKSLTTGTRNMAIGTFALAAVVTGARNIAIGYNAGQSWTGDTSVFIGTDSGAGTSGSNNIFIGYLSGQYQATPSNLILIDALDRGSAANELSKDLIVGSLNANELLQILTINSSIGIFEQSPVTPFEITHTAPYLTLHNSTEEDGAGGRESRIIARGEQSGTEESILGYMEFAHDGAADDEKGLWRILLNDGNDGTTPSLTPITCYADGTVEFTKTVYFDTEIDNGNSGAADTIDFTAGNKQKSTLTAACTFTFTEPAGPCNLTLKLVQGGTGSYTVVWPGDVYWPAGTAPTLTTAVGGIDIVSFYYDGTNFYGQAALAFAIPV